MRWVRDRYERGASAVEYGVLIAGMVALVIAPVTLLGDNLSTLFNRAAAVIAPTTQEASDFILDPADCDVDGNYTGSTDGWMWTRYDYYTDGIVETTGDGATFSPLTDSYTDMNGVTHPVTAAHDYVWSSWYTSPYNPNHYSFTPPADDTNLQVFENPCVAPQ